MKKWMMPVAAGLLAMVTLAAHAEDIRAFEPDSMERLVESHKGKPFVLLIWSLDCAYCHVSMKNLAQERSKRPDFHVVTLSTDPAADPQLAELMRKKLKSVRLEGNAWAYGDAAPEQLRYAIDPAWYGEKPRSYWFNARGERIAYSGVINEAVMAKFARK